MLFRSINRQIRPHAQAIHYIGRYNTHYNYSNKCHQLREFSIGNIWDGQNKYHRERVTLPKDDKTTTTANKSASSTRPKGWWSHPNRPKPIVKPPSQFVLRLESYIRKNQTKTYMSILLIIAIIGGLLSSDVDRIFSLNSSYYSRVLTLLRSSDIVGKYLGKNIQGIGGKKNLQEEIYLHKGIEHVRISVSVRGSIGQGKCVCIFQKDQHGRQQLYSLQVLLLNGDVLEVVSEGNTVEMIRTNRGNNRGRRMKW